MQVELLNRRHRRTNLELAIAMADYIDHFYNPSRRQCPRLPHTGRIRATTLTPTPGHVVIRCGPLNGDKATLQPQRGSNPCLHLERVSGCRSKTLTRALSLPPFDFAMPAVAGNSKSVG